MAYKDLNAPETIAALKKSRDNWYKNNKQRQIKNQKEKKEALRKWLDDYKRTLSCTDCPMTFEEYPECCDFHHLDPAEKDTEVGVLVSYSLKKLKQEIAKCVPLCANCHRKRHRVKNTS